MRSLLIQTNINNSNPGDYPKGRIRDNDGSQNGTPVNESVYGDMLQNCVKILAEAGIAFSEQPDNVTNGYQLHDALMSLAGKNDLIQAITVFSANTLLIPIKVGILKDREAIIFDANFNSVNSHVLVRGSDLVTKTLNIVGTFYIGQKVMLINTVTEVLAFGLYDSQFIPDLKGRITFLENSFTTILQKLAIFTVGGAMFIWNKPVNQIPAGYQEVTNMKGKTIFGFDIANPLFNVVGNPGGSATKTIARVNLPAEKIKVYPQGFRYGENGATPGAFYGSSGDSGDVGGSGFTESENLGSGTPMDVLNPYRIVAFIEWATV